MAIEREVNSPFESKRSGGFMHMSMTRAFFVRAIQEHGAKLLLPDWTGTDREAIDAINADGREYFVPGSCDNQNPDGTCAGHRGR